MMKQLNKDLGNFYLYIFTFLVTGTKIPERKMSMEKLHIVAHSFRGFGLCLVGLIHVADDVSDSTMQKSF